MQFFTAYIQSLALLNPEDKTKFAKSGTTQFILDFMPLLQELSYYGPAREMFCELKLFLYFASFGKFL